MSKFLTKTALLTICAFSPFAYAVKVAVCTHEGAVREIHIDYEVDGQTVPCTVNYVKETGTQALWRAENMEGYCEQKAADFMAKQESWGWSCESQEAEVTPAEMASEPMSEAEVVDEASGAVAEEVDEMKESE
ncbi:hypothetical protein TDB9533_00982 [Thalassocella blandensis]|nr:hypothetical protein TDB9533_00982 [Thalassocella blandensis]